MFCVIVYSLGPARSMYTPSQLLHPLPRVFARWEQARPSYFRCQFNGMNDDATSGFALAAACMLEGTPFDAPGRAAPSRPVARPLVPRATWSSMRLLKRDSHHTASTAHSHPSSSRWAGSAFILSSYHAPWGDTPRYRSEILHHHLPFRYFGALTSSSQG